MPHENFEVQQPPFGADQDSRKAPKRQEKQPRETNPASRESPESSEPTDEQLCLGFDEIRDSLHQRPEDYTRIIREIGEEERLRDADFLTEEHRSMLAVLYEFDRPTFEHSLRVYRTVREKVESDSVVGTYLRERIHDEGIAASDLYLASIFHDIGKTAIPVEVLHNSLSRREWARLANRHAQKDGSEPPYSTDILESATDAQLDDYFRSAGNPLEKVPALEAFTPHDIQILKEHGIGGVQTFMGILALHERATRTILSAAGMGAAALLAGNHHGYSTPRELSSDTSATALRTGYLETVLRSADISDALLDTEREYKKSFTPLQVLDCLVGYAKRGHLKDTTLVRYWIADELAKLPTADASPDEAVCRKRIESFLGE